MLGSCWVHDQVHHVLRRLGMAVHARMLPSASRHSNTMIRTWHCYKVTSRHHHWWWRGGRGGGDSLLPHACCCRPIKVLALCLCHVCPQLAKPIKLDSVPIPHPGKISRRSSGIRKFSVLRYAGRRLDFLRLLQASMVILRDANA